jgi:type IV pilus assembly protein PilV
MLNERHKMAATPKSVPAARQQGVALLEALIAILIFSLGVLGLIGLQASATKTATQARFRMEAGQVATQRIADIWLDRANMAGYDGIAPAPGLPEGTIATSVVGSVVTITVSWRAPGDTVPNSHLAIANVTTN